MYNRHGAGTIALRFIFPLLLLSLISAGCVTVVPYSPVNFTSGKTLGQDEAALQLQMTSAYSIVSSIQEIDMPDRQPGTDFDLATITDTEYRIGDALGFQAGFRYGILPSVDLGFDAGLYFHDMLTEAELMARAQVQIELTPKTAEWNVSVLPGTSMVLGSTFNQNGSGPYVLDTITGDTPPAYTFNSSLGSKLYTLSLAIPVSRQLGSEAFICIAPLFEWQIYSVNYQYSRVVNSMSMELDSYNYEGTFSDASPSFGAGVYVGVFNNLRLGATVMSYEMEGERRLVPFFGIGYRVEL